MKLLFLCTLFLAPLLVLAKITLTSFSYSKGVVTMTVKKWSDAPPTYTIQLAHDGTTTDLVTGIETTSGKQTVNLPPVPVGSGYTIRLVSAIAGDSEVYYTSKTFSVQDGDFSAVTASSVSAASTEAAASTSGASDSASTAAASSVFTTYTDANGSVVTALATATDGSAAGTGTETGSTATTTFTTYTDSAGVVSTLPVVPVTTVTSATVLPITTTDSAGSLTTFSATSLIETIAPVSAASAAATTSANAAIGAGASLPNKIAVAFFSCVFAGAYLLF